MLFPQTTAWKFCKYIERKPAKFLSSSTLRYPNLSSIFFFFFHSKARGKYNNVIPSLLPPPPKNFLAFRPRLGLYSERNTFKGSSGGNRRKWYFTRLNVLFPEIDAGTMEPPVRRAKKPLLSACQLQVLARELFSTFARNVIRNCEPCCTALWLRPCGPRWKFFPSLPPRPLTHPPPSHPPRPSALLPTERNIAAERPWILALMIVAF